MSSLNDDNRTSDSHADSNYWQRVRQAQQSGELNRQNSIGQFEQKRKYRQNLADTSAKSMKTATTSPQHQFQQLVERVRELQKEIVPDFLLYQMPTTYSPFAAITPSSNVSQGSISNLPYRQSLSISSTSSSSSIPSQRMGLSSRILERAHQIPERFWLDWQQKQMQDQIEELEYIKNNIQCTPNFPSFPNAVETKDTDLSKLNRQTSYDDLCRQRLTFLQEANRLANERRASLVQSATLDETIPEKIKNESHKRDEDDERSIIFDQRSQGSIDTAHINDFDEFPSDSSAPLASVQKASSTLDRSQLAISLPFTYKNARESTIGRNNHRQASIEPMLEKVIEVNDSAMQTTSPSNSIADVAQIDTELNVTLIKREHQQQMSPILYSKAIMNRSIEFRKFQPISCHKILTKDVTKPISVLKGEEINDSQSASLTLTSKSSRLRLPFINNDKHPNDYTQSNQKQNNKSFSCSIMPSKDNFLFSPTLLFTCRNRRRTRKKKINSSNLSLIPTTSLKNNLILLTHSYCYEKRNDNHLNAKNMVTLKIPHNTSMVSNQTTLKWKQNDGGFQHDVLSNGTNNDKYAIRSLSATSTTDCFIQRHRRKQTRLKRKTESKERKEKKKKKERKKRSPSSTSKVEATEASLFQYFAVDTPAIDTSAIFYPHEQARCADKSGAKEKNCFLSQTLVEHQQRQKHESSFHLTMADSHGGNATSNALSKRKENVRVFIRRRRCRRTIQRRKPILFQSSSSVNSRETLLSSADNVEELVSFIERKINSKHKKKPRSNKNIIVVNYKPVFVNPRREKTFRTVKSTSSVKPKPKSTLPTDDEFSSATHYSRQRTFTTTSSDCSPLRSMSISSQNPQSVSLDVPDVEDPLKFIEIMYQQLFTEDGRLRNATETVAFAHCVKQIVTNSRRNSTSSSVFTNRSKSTHLKNVNLDKNHDQRKYSASSNYHPQPSKIPVLCSPPPSATNGYYGTSSEEEQEKESETLKQTIIPYQKVITDNDVPRKNLDQLNVTNHYHTHRSSSNSTHLKRSSVNRTVAASNSFHISKDDTGSEDLDTFSDFDFMHTSNIIIQPSSSIIDDEFTRTDSKLSSSGYQSLDRSRKSFVQQKSYSENDLLYAIDKSYTSIKSINPCSICMHSPNITVIPQVVSTPSSFSAIIKRIQQPIGKILMKYVNFILISKNVLLLPLFIFLLRQRSIHVGN
ncbi:unnamed protein product [Rotaria socialis]|uniref:Uncharacterized protein n=2 Tax=Rotaria socialis TaxID=392032 RepID=A0A820B1W3_9BILA|nr:unnamed protein product [Rotaria socialis]